MDLTIRALAPDEHGDFLRTVEAAFGGHPTAEDLAVDRSVFEPERSLGAFVGSELVGAASSFTFRLTVPGGQAPMAGVTGVGVLPTHRRRGILTALMGRQLEDLRERGEALAGLWASEGGIYGRFGYGVAAHVAAVEIDTARSAFLREMVSRSRVRLVDKAEALARMPAVYERVRVRQPGFLDRPTAAWWNAEFADLESHRGGAGELFFAVLERNGADAGYVAYRVRHDWQPAGPDHTIVVQELLGDDPTAEAALWRYVLDVDLVGRVTARDRPAHEPLLHLLLEPRRLRLTVRDGLWLRLVDVPGALQARRYGAAGVLTIEVDDAFCPWNRGTFELEAGTVGAGACRPTGRAPDLRLRTEDLAAAFLGGTGFRALARAGRIEETAPGALARADELFAADPPPWCPWIF